MVRGTLIVVAVMLVLVVTGVQSAHDSIRRVADALARDGESVSSSIGDNNAAAEYRRHNGHIHRPAAKKKLSGDYSIIFKRWS